MKFRVKLTWRAERDLKDIWLSIAQHSFINADRILDVLGARIDSLVEFPDRGVIRDEIAKGARSLIEGNYLIFYRKQKSTIEVTRVVHGRMDLSKLSLD